MGPDSGLKRTMHILTQFQRRFPLSFPVLLTIVVAMAPPCRVARADFGPLQTVNRLPLHLLFLKPRPVSAEMPKRGALDSAFSVAYSNTYFEHRNDRWDVLMDMEMLIAEISIVYGLTSKVAIRLDAPLPMMSRGFMDGFLENYHNLVGVSNYDRENRSKNSFAYRAAKDGRAWFEGREGLQLADMIVSIQFGLFDGLDNGRTGGALLLRLKLPTGDADTGLGSGKFDAGIYLPLKWHKAQWSVFAMPGATAISDPQTTDAIVLSRNSFSFFGGVGYDFSRRTTGVIQLNYYTSPVEVTGLNELDNGALELALGFHRRIADDWILEFAFCEDLTLAVPDFNVHIGLRWNYQLR